MSFLIILIILFDKCSNFWISMKSNEFFFLSEINYNCMISFHKIFSYSGLFWLWNTFADFHTCGLSLINDFNKCSLMSLNSLVDFKSSLEKMESGHSLLLWLFVILPKMDTSILFIIFFNWQWLTFLLRNDWFTDLNTSSSESE